MPASDIPGYLQGFRFKATNLSGGIFTDLSGYGEHCRVDVGTPAFVDVGGIECMTLDNTTLLSFLLPIRWEGTMIVSGKPTMGSNATIYPMIFGGAAAIASNGTFRVVRASASNYQHRLIIAGSTLTNSVGKTTDAFTRCAFAVQQSNRTGYATEDGVTVTTAGPVTSATNGNGVAPGYTVTVGPDSHRVRLGNLTGTIGDTTVSALTYAIAEVHFFEGNPLVDAAAAVQAFLAEPIT